MKKYCCEDWKKAVKNDSNCAVFDVRSEEEYCEGHIPGASCADVQDPKGFMDFINSLDKDKTYFLYCNSGNRSNQAGLVMEYNGFKKVFNLDGGIQSWDGAVERS